MKIMDIDAKCLRLYAPEWYRRPEFLAVLERPAGTWPTATWHKPGTPPDEYSDVFLTFDNQEGSDVFEDPGCQDIWQAICDAAAQIGMTYGVVWISNLADS